MCPLSYGFGNLTERGDGVDLLFGALPASAAQKKVRRRRIRHHQVEYIKEFFRILKPGGKALFQVRTPKGSSPKPGSFAEKIYDFKMERLKPFWKVVRGRPPIQVHTISPEVVEQVITSCDAKLLDVKVVDKRVRRWHKNLRYYAMKPKN